MVLVSNATLHADAVSHYLLPYAKRGFAPVSHLKLCFLNKSLVKLIREASPRIRSFRCVLQKHVLLLLYKDCQVRSRASATQLGLQPSFSHIRLACNSQIVSPFLFLCLHFLQLKCRTCILSLFPE